MKRAKILSLALVALLIALATALFVFPAAAEETLPEAGATMTEDVVTEYGTIPKEYANQTDYPFVVFKNGAFVLATANYGINGQASALTNSREAGSVILLRRDFTYTAGEYGELSIGHPDTIFDLGGHTFTSAQYVFQSYKRSNEITSFTVKNGTFLLTGSKALMRNATWSGAGYTGGYGFNFDFENVTVKLGEGATATSLLVGQDTVHQYDMFMNATFTDCTFDTTAVTTEGLTLFDATNSLYQVNAVINGCEIKASSTISFMNATGGDADSSLIFAEDANGNFVTLTLPSSVVFDTDSVYNDVYAFVKTSDDGNTATYEIAPAPGTVVTEYGIIPKEYADETTYPLVVFRNGEFIVGSGTLYDLLELFVKEEVIRETKAEGRSRYYIITEKGQQMLEIY